jgi:hypothetical protein
MHFRIRRPSPALFVAMLALIVAMSGSAFAIQKATQGGDSLITKRTLSGNRLRLNTVSGAEVADLAWHNLSLLHGWSAHYEGLRPPAWAIDAQGIVHFRGAIRQPTGSDEVFARLPIAVRPSTYVWVSTNTGNFGEAGRVLVEPTGQIRAVGIDQSNAQVFTSLDGLTYALTG